MSPVTHYFKHSDVFSNGVKKIVLLFILFSLLPSVAFGQAAGAGDTTPPASAGGTENVGGATYQVNPDGTASANYNFKNQGIFGCSLNGSYAMSVGTTAAIGGVYVPVNDAAVTLNTGMLVYKECVLRQVVDAEAAAALGGQAQQALLFVVQNNLFVQDFRQERSDRKLNTITEMVQELNECRELDKEFCQTLVRQYAQRILQDQRSPMDVLSCDLPDGTLQQIFGADQAPGDDSWWALLTDQGCNPIYTSQNLALMIEAEDAAREEAVEFELESGNGYYAQTETDPVTGARKILTPSYLVSENVKGAVQSGWQRMINANDVGQMTTALYSGLVNQVITTGLTKLTQRNGNQPSYINQMTAEQSALVRTNAVNAALQILAAARQIEGGFLQALNSIAQTLTNTIAQLRNGEKQCWAYIVENVCSGPVAADKTCSEKISCTQQQIDEGTCPTGAKLRVATSTAFSQAVITEKISPLATPALDRIKEGEAAVKLIDQLIAGVTNTNSINTQRLALQQLDTLVAQRKIHNQYDLQTAQRQQQSVTDSMQTLVQDTIKAWADDTNPAVGWCNYKNQSVLELWKQRWRI